MASAQGTRIADYLGVLSALAQEGEDVLIVGGHAVNLWAELYLTQEPRLSRFLPFTSRDLDLHKLRATTASVLGTYGARAVRQRAPFGKVFDLVEAVFTLEDRDGRTLNIEVLKALPGLTARAVAQAAVRVEYQGLQLSVLDPIALLKAKAHNLAHLDQTARQDGRHFRILILCIRAYLREWLRRCRSSESPRLVLDLLERTLRTMLHPEVLGAARTLRTHPNQALPLLELEKSRSPQIVRFLAERLPRWEKSLSKRMAQAKPGRSSGGARP